MTFTGGDMKRSASELALEEFLRKAGNILEIPDGIESFLMNKIDSKADSDAFFNLASLEHGEIVNGFSSGLIDDFQSFQKHTPKKTSISATMDSQSSICAGSPTSANTPKDCDNQGRGATSGSSGEQSDDDYLEIEAGSCEQSKDPMFLKRIRRMVSNRESARRSRRRKQAHLADIELQVELLRGENASLFKQLTNATQQYRDSDTSNRVLKSNVEALRAKVKLAEDMVARGTYSSSLNQLLHTQLLSPQQLNNHNLCPVANVSPTITISRDDASFPGMSIGIQNSALGVGNANTNNTNMNNNGIMSDTVSCASDIWH